MLVFEELTTQKFLQILINTQVLVLESENLKVKEVIEEIKQQFLSEVNE